MFDSGETLGEGLLKFSGDHASSIPFIVWLLENPDSPLSLPGRISLHNHDCIHVLLDKGMNPEEEAFVLGWTMGNDSRTKVWHVRVFKFFARYVYPGMYRFSNGDLMTFDRAFKEGQQAQMRDINSCNFDTWKDVPLGFLRGFVLGEVRSWV